jgi:adenosine deaminase/adenosine deaminase CECR1
MSIFVFKKQLIGSLLISLFLNLHAEVPKTFLTEINTTQVTSNFYESLLNDTPQANEALLHLFFTKMPKGGDLHHHYSGSIYAETYLNWVDKKGWYIDKCTLKIIKKPKITGCKLLTVKQLMSNTLLYPKLLSLWSDKDYGKQIYNQPPPDSNFFNTFSYFEAISYEYIDLGLHILKQRALQENISYIETILSMVWVGSTHYFNTSTIDDYTTLLRKATSQKEVDKILDKISTLYLDDKKFLTTIDNYVEKLQKDHIGIDDANFTMRYQTYAVRVLDPVQVFTNLFTGYLAAEQSPLIVGVNIVAPENNTVALNDYTLHMRMYNYLARKYPTVHRALHAGELTLGMVRPKNLTFHIAEAIDIAKAERIGHGTDLSYEQDSIKLLNKMKKHAAVEINFTSNAFILGVKGNKHPYLIYAGYDVPLVISTDDSGVSRNNLTSEYMLLATRYQPTYTQIKSYIYNSITYSFLKKEKKVSLKKDLDKRFIIFEKEMSNLYKEVKSNLNKGVLHEE